MTSERLAAGIVRILAADGSTVGAGFLASNRLVVTCAHVVEAAGSGAGGSICIRFLNDETRTVRCTVPAAWWRGFTDGDIAVLCLSEPLPATARPIPIGEECRPGDTVRTIGFPSTGTVQWLNAAATVRGMVRDGTHERIDLDSERAVPGFSGAPLYDDRRGVVVGVLTTIMAAHTSQRRRFVTFAIPISDVVAVCPDLRPSERSPYRNLEAFGEDDADAFFGRDHLTEMLTARVGGGTRLLLVLGPSGCGKSSVVRAGLLQRLRSGELPQSDRWHYVVARPSSQPFAELEAAGMPVQLRRAPGAEAEYAIGEITAPRLLLLLDQFEDLFVLCEPDVARRFLAMLCDAVRSTAPLCIVLVMRDDFYPSIARLGGQLLGLLGEAGLLNVPATITEAEIRSMIEGPARSYGLEIESSLTEVLVRDVYRVASAHDGIGVESTVLPLLESALSLVWSRRRAALIPFEAYPENGITSALSLWASDVYQRLGDGMRDIARRVLLSLIEVDFDQRRLPTRRRRRIVELIDDAEDEGPVRTVVHRLASARLLVTSRDAVTGADTVEIIHDALIERWSLLRDWVRADLRFLMWRSGTERIAAQWLDSHDESRLFHGRALDEAVAWLEERPELVAGALRDFVHASVAQRDEAARRARAAGLRARALQALAVIGAVVAVVAVVIAQGALRQGGAATTISLARLYEQSAVRQTGRRGGVAVAFALEAYALVPNSESRDLLVSTLRRYESVMGRLAIGASDLRFDASGRRLFTVLAADGPSRPFRMLEWDVNRRSPSGTPYESSCSTASDSHLTLSPNGRYVAAYCTRTSGEKPIGVIVVWNRSDHSVVRTMAFSSDFSITDPRRDVGVAFVDDRKIAAFYARLGNGPQRVVCWDLRTGHIVSQRDLDGALALKLSRDGATLLAVISPREGAYVYQLFDTHRGFTATAHPRNLVEADDFSQVDIDPKRATIAVTKQTFVSRPQLRISLIQYRTGAATVYGPIDVVGRPDISMIPGGNTMMIASQSQLLVALMPGAAGPPTFDVRELPVDVVIPKLAAGTLLALAASPDGRQLAVGTNTGVVFYALTSLRPENWEGLSREDLLRRACGKTYLSFEETRSLFGPRTFFCDAAH
jgi:Trypsin-like peptidase domain